MEQKLQLSKELDSGCSIRTIYEEGLSHLIDIERVDHIVNLGKYEFLLQKKYSTKAEKVELHLNDNCLVLPYAYIRRERMSGGSG